MRIHVLGNCTAKPVADILALTHDTWQVSYDYVHLIDLERDMAAYEARMRAADLIIACPVSPGYRNDERLSLDWIMANRKSACVAVAAVPFYFEGYFPELRSIGDLSSFEMPYFDYNIVDAYLKGMSPEAAYLAISAPDFYSEAYVRERVTASIAELRRREAEPYINLRISGLIAEGYDREMLFYTNNHPTNGLLGAFCKSALEEAGIDAVVKCPARPLLGAYAVSPYESVLKVFPRLSSDNDGFIEIEGSRINRIDYVMGCYEFYDSELGRDCLDGAAHASEAYIDFIAERDRWQGVELST